MILTWWISSIYSTSSSLISRWTRQTRRAALICANNHCHDRIEIAIPIISGDQSVCAIPIQAKIRPQWPKCALRHSSVSSQHWIHSKSACSRKERKTSLPGLRLPPRIWLFHHHHFLNAALLAWSQRISTQRTIFGVADATHQSFASGVISQNHWQCYGAVYASLWILRQGLQWLWLDKAINPSEAVASHQAKRMMHLGDEHYENYVSFAGEFSVELDFSSEDC